MILIADSGSTKTDWLFFDKDNCSELITTTGFNPLFHDINYIVTKITENNSLSSVKNNITHIYYFGAGCSNANRRGILKKSLQTIFTKAQIIVEHDLKGAALAACKGEHGISCILGTGSNSCYFDGKNILEKTPSLGFILGDEGSGASIGKCLLNKYLYNQLPDYLNDKFKNKLLLTKELILENVYKKPHANAYLAAFTKELYEFKNEKWVMCFLSTHFNVFLETHVCCFENKQDTNINFVGSIAFYFSEILQKSCEKLHLNVGNIIKKPIEPLKNYYYTKHYN